MTDHSDEEIVQAPYKSSLHKAYPLTRSITNLHYTICREWK